MDSNGNGAIEVNVIIIIIVNLSGAKAWKFWVLHSFLFCTSALIFGFYSTEISLEMKKWSSQWTQFMQLRKEAWKKKFRTSTEHMNIWTHNWTAPNVSGFIAQLVEHRTGIARSRVQTPLKSWFFFQASLRNCINCVHCDDHFFISISFPQFIYDLFHISFTEISLF